MISFGVLVRGSILSGLLVLLLISSASARDFGVDVSHYQGATGVSQDSWNQMFAEGKKFAFIKATEGLTGPDDAAMANNVARGTAAGLLVGVYHYPHPENRPTTNGAILEADHFISYAGTAIGPGRLRPVLDLEGTGAASLSKTALTDWVIAFSDRIIAQKGSNAAPIIYCTRSFARDEVDSRLANYDLWLAYLTNVDWSIADPPPTTAYPKPTGVFSNWCFWQYNWTGTAGGISPMDLDVCHSEYKSLESFIIPHPPLIISNPVLNNGTFQFTFTNTPFRSLEVVASTHLSLMRSNWFTIGSLTEGPPGYFQFTGPATVNGAPTFYSVRAP